ncbi:hypothetical protein SAMN04488543_4072 [Friedmanniella luteola]|uniref:Uncharacterized protein n=1 Tax=Friedmanniella luteola TaxID=546871 RepID=A0A1H1ZXI0_9ACTN|nr:hypothetical protein [Friedmanniella luteola]SDT38373.1 hypothetical protein SAMN04488543_4072 [Friedmanniella luteola]
MTGLALLVLLLAAVVAGLEVRHRRSGEAVLRRVRAAAGPGDRPWWPPGPVVRRS